MEEIRKLSHNGGAIMIDTQLMKGILEGCVLSVIAEHETYGYEILQRLTESGFTELGEGTMYPDSPNWAKERCIRCSRGWRRTATSNAAKRNHRLDRSGNIIR